VSRPLALAALLAVAPISAATADELAECESRAAFDLPGDSRLRIDRAGLISEKADVMAGREFVSSVLHGPAELSRDGVTTQVRFICLFGGSGPIFVWVLPE
jgi:hypothetical protein